MAMYLAIGGVVLLVLVLGVVLIAGSRLSGGSVSGGSSRRAIGS